ncbi:MAG: methyltransferase [Clostridiales bacterium]|nr:methyltransferase [Clostridiales bacterium]
MFQFKQFNIDDNSTAMKIGTDGVLLGAWAFTDINPHEILDIGTGSGLIALMMAQRYPHASITAIEIDPQATSQAIININNSPWKQSIKVVNTDFRNFTPSQQFDALISNPPFFDQTIYSPSSARNTARHEDSLPLSTLMDKAYQLLTPGGKLAIILPHERIDEAIYLSALRHLDCTHITHVKSKPSLAPIRAMMQFKKGITTKFSRETITLRDNNGTPTQRYLQLTHDFYTKLK